MVDARLEAQITLQSEQFQAGIQRLYTKMDMLQKKLKKTETIKPFDPMVKRFNDFRKAIIAVGAAIAGFEAGKFILKQAMDAVESENLFTVSMGKMADSARLWSDETAKALGLNAFELRKNLGTFNVMFESMGLGTDKAYEYSKSLTVLANDMASFYNISTDEAFTKLRSGMTGEIEPLKHIGINIGETALQEEALRQGISKKVTVMREGEKVNLRYLAIMRATSKAQGDLARTLDSPSNKLRVLQQRFILLAITLGQTLLPAMVKIVDTFKVFVDNTIVFIEKNATSLTASFTAIATAITSISTALGQVDFNPLVAGLNLVAFATNFISIAANQAIMMIRAFKNTIVNLGGINDVTDLGFLGIAKQGFRMGSNFLKGGAKYAQNEEYQIAKNKMKSYNKEGQNIGDDWLNSFDKNWQAMKDLSVNGLITKMKELNAQLKAMKAKGQDTAGVEKAIGKVNDKLKKTKDHLSDINKLLEKNFNLAVARAWADRFKLIEEMTRQGRLFQPGRAWSANLPDSTNQNQGQIVYQFNIGGKSITLEGVKNPTAQQRSQMEAKAKYLYDMLDGVLNNEIIPPVVWSTP